LIPTKQIDYAYAISATCQKTAITLLDVSNVQEPTNPENAPKHLISIYFLKLLGVLSKTNSILNNSQQLNLSPLGQKCDVTNLTKFSVESPIKHLDYNKFT